MLGDFYQGHLSPPAEDLRWKVALQQELYFFPVSSLVLRFCKLSVGVLGFMLEEGMRAEQVAPLLFSLGLFWIMSSSKTCYTGSETRAQCGVVVGTRIPNLRLAWG